MKGEALWAFAFTGLWLAPMAWSYWDERRQR